NVEPDSFDLDNYLAKYGNTSGSVTHDNNIRTLKVLPINFNPTTCDLQNGFYFFAKPIAPIITTCICKKYHTYFTSQHITISTSSQPTTENISDSSNSMEIDFDIKLFKSLKSLSRSKFQPKHEISHPFPTFYKNFEEILKIFDCHSSTLYSTKNILQNLVNINIQYIDICVNSCIAYTDEYVEAMQCSICLATQFNKNRIVQKSAAYYPIIPRLKLQYADSERSKLFRYRSNYVLNTNTYCDIFDRHLYKRLLHNRMIKDEEI
ncbi:5901_t:CDS:2, partial [Scutellospora calospora]